MILVFGGTTEGKIVAGILEKKECPYFYSTKTEIDFQSGNFGTYRFGAFDKNSLITFCKDHHIQLIIHASHPFAEILHQTIAEVSQQLQITVLRYERHYPERMQHHLIHYLPSYEKVLEHLNEHRVETLLALSGVQTIEKLKSYWRNNKTFFRILPRSESRKIAERSAFPEENLILEMPVNDVRHELNMIHQYNIQCILTKESGESGFLSTKIQAALQSNTPLLILERPKLPETFIPVLNETDLLTHLPIS